MAAHDDVAARVLAMAKEFGYNRVELRAQLALTDDECERLLAGRRAVDVPLARSLGRLFATTAAYWLPAPAAGTKPAEARAAAPRERPTTRRRLAIARARR